MGHISIYWDYENHLTLRQEPIRKGSHQTSGKHLRMKATHDLHLTRIYSKIGKIGGRY